MTREKLYNETIDILREAFFKGMLKHGIGCDCAVGNLVQAKGFTAWKWGLIVICYSQDRLDRRRRSEAEREVRATGYTIGELKKIEAAFERGETGVRNNSKDSKDFDGFKGLINVVDVLSEIHSVEEKKTKKVKTQFMKA